MNREEETKKMPIWLFWTRFGFWLVFSVVVPIAFVAWKYGLFTAREGSEMTLTGWGILAVVIISVFMLKLIAEAKKGLSYGSMLCQCIDGYRWLIPVVLIIFLLEAVKDNIDAFETSLIVFTVSEAVAIPINPMRKWAEQNNIEHTENFLVRTIKKALDK